MIIINAEKQILGRLATIAAKQALLGQEVAVINCEKCYVTGDKSYLKADYKVKRERGEWSRGPHYPRDSHMIVKRTIRGMIPYKQGRGKEAFARIRCYIGLPKQFEGQKTFEMPKTVSISKVPNLNYLSLHEVSKNMGAKRL